jgi:hypothetical protein
VQALRELFGLEVDSPLGESAAVPPAEVTSLEERRRKRS